LLLHVCEGVVITHYNDPLVFFDKQFWRSSSSVSVCCGGHFAGMVWAHLSP